MTATCITGGAKGADTFFASCASEAGHCVIHKSFVGHGIKVKHGVVDVLDFSLDDMHDKMLHKVSKIIKRNLRGASEYVINLLKRDMDIALTSDDVYAVGFIINEKLTGGTAWASYESASVGDNVYVFDQNTDRWFILDSFFKFQPIQEVPKPSGFYAGIGSRDLRENGKQAILNLYK